TTSDLEALARSFEPSGAPSERRHLTVLFCDIVQSTSLAKSLDRELKYALDRLAGAELIFAHGTPPSAVYVFKHALVQETAYETMLKSKRQQLHEHIAKALEDRFYAHATRDSCSPLHRGCPS